MPRSSVIFALLLCAASAAPRAYSDDGVTPAWFGGLQAQLQELGLVVDASNTAEAVVLGIVREVDEKARAVSEDEYARILSDRRGEGYRTGLSIGISNGLPYVSGIATGSPAASMIGKIFAGDLITGIGTAAFNRIALPDALDLLAPPGDAPVAVTLVHLGVTNTVSIPRYETAEEAVALAELLPGNMGYLLINGLYRNSGREVVSLVRAWDEAGCDGLILDLRGAAGDDVNAVTRIASIFGPPDRFLFAFRDLHRQDLLVASAVRAPPVDMPVMVLIDGATSGAAEVLAAVLNGATRQALLIGESTAADFTLRENVTIAGRDILTAVKALDTADGIRYTGRFGVQPAIEVSGPDRDTYDYEPPEDLLDGREKLEEEELDLQIRRRTRGDGMLERAVDILTGLKSLNKEDVRLSSPDVF